MSKFPPGTRLYQPVKTFDTLMYFYVDEACFIREKREGTDVGGTWSDHKGFQSLVEAGKLIAVAPDDA